MTPAERSVTYDKKMIKRPIHQFLPANELVNVQRRKTHWRWNNGLHRLRLQHNGKGQIRGGLLKKMGRTSVLCVSSFYKTFARRKWRFSLQATAVSSVDRTSHVSHKQTLFCVCLKSALLRHFSKESSSRARFMSHAQCSWLDRIPFPLPRSTPSPLYPLNGSISCNPQQGVPFGRLAEQSPTTRARRRVSLVFLAEVSTEAWAVRWARVGRNQLRNGTLWGRCLSWPQEKGDTCSDRPHCCKCRFLRELHLTTPSLIDTSVSTWTATGQRMIHATVMLWTEQLRRADNVPYTRGFAEGLLRELLLCQARGSRDVFF